MGGTPKDIKKDWGLGGLLVMDDLPDGRKAGTMIWGGAPNLIWVSRALTCCKLLANYEQWVDREAGLCGLYAGQVWPPGDAKCAVLDRKFEEAMYQRYGESKQRVSTPRL